ncbi:IS30 family transposase [Lactovum miscens]|uniref:IS30 family transposase n=1 Tax=Lactovum miscens TaxID=190387 RepID=UPI001614B2D4|nr:IS30 family transposase [Lactovum miscens]
MQDYSNTKGKHLTLIERRQIERWHNKDKLSNRRIAQLLNKAPQTINNELRQGKVHLKIKTKYSAAVAQASYNTSRRHCGRPSKFTKVLNVLISKGVREKLSLEVLSHKLSHPVCLRTLYNWIEVGRLDVKYHDLLYPHYKKVKKLRSTQPKRPFGLSIEQRPEAINQREEFGHYEIDTVLLTKAKGECLLTLTERKTRSELIRLIPDKSAQSVNTALLALQGEVQFKSITSDNGREFARLHEVVSCPVYYCHAYASFERGSNENHNRMIRRFLPKGTRTTTKEFVTFIEGWINSYPRKMFNYKNSKQMLKLANL